MPDDASQNRSKELAELLAELAPTLRARIRSRKSRRRAAFSTSDIYATVVRRTIDIESRGGVHAVRGQQDRSAAQSPQFWAFLHTLIDRALWRKDRTERRSEHAREMRGHHHATRAEGPSPSDRVVDRELLARLELVLATLGEADQALLRLRLEGKPWDEIATATKQTPETCRQRWHRLLERIGQTLGDPLG